MRIIMRKRRNIIYSFPTLFVVIAVAVPKHIHKNFDQSLLSSPIDDTRWISQENPYCLKKIRYKNNNKSWGRIGSTTFFSNTSHCIPISMHQSLPSVLPIQFIWWYHKKKQPPPYGLDKVSESRHPPCTPWSNDNTKDRMIIIIWSQLQSPPPLCKIENKNNRFDRPNFDHK